MTRDLVVRMLGEFQIRHGDRFLTDTFTTRLQSFFAYLLLNQDKTLSRQQLAFHFWPDSTDAQARANLRKLVYRLRQVFPDVVHYLDLEGATLGWQPEAPIRLDVAGFESRLREAEAAALQQQPALLSKALTLYTGDLLPDLYDDWFLSRREQLRVRYLGGLDLLAELLEAKRDYAAATETVRQLLRVDPLRESAYRRLMRLQALGGDVAGALRTYHRCVRQLEQELGVEPGEATQQAYRRLLDRREPPVSAGAGRAVRQLPLVGREAAWQQLLATWRRAVAGRPQVILISGEAGIGKTRLAEELLSWTGRQDITTLTATCFATQAPLPLRPIADWLRAEAVDRTLPSLPPRWRSEVVRVLPELLATDASLEMPRPLTEAWQQQHFFMALAEAVTAAGEPLLLFLDDLHWADAETLDWLHFLAQQKSGHRFLLLATIRAEEVGRRHLLPTWQEGVARALPLHEIRLGPLDATATAALASHLLRGALDEETAAALYAETEGNPLFAVEIVRAGFPRAEVPLPEKVRSIIEIRLNRLTPSARKLAALAAVVGRSFPFSILAAASPQPEEEVLAGVDELWQRQIIREQAEDDYDFSHDKIRQVVLAQLSRPRRRWWHGRVAEALEQLLAGEWETDHGRIAAHWEEAGHPRKAVGHYLEAARAASHLYAHEEAIGYLRRALALLPADQGRHRAIHAQMGEAYMALGQFEEAAACLQEAANKTRDVVERASLLGRRMHALNGNRRFGEAKETCREALSLLDAAPPGEPRAGTWRTWIDLHLGLLDVLYFANERSEMEQICRAMSEPVGVHGTARQHAHYLAAVSRMRCRILRYRLTDEDVAERLSALQWARETEDEKLIADHQFGLGFILLWAGHPLRAIGELQQAATWAEALGNIPLQSRCLTYLGIAFRMSGDEANVRHTVEKMMPVAAAEGNQSYLGVAEALRAWLRWRAGDIAAAERYGRAALRQWEATVAAYPMQWLARLPLLAVALAQAGSTLDLAGVGKQARAMLDPPQQRLPDVLAEALAATVAVDTPAAMVTRLQEVCRVAQEQGYL